MTDTEMSVASAAEQVRFLEFRYPKRVLRNSYLKVTSKLAKEFQNTSNLKTTILE